MLDAFRFTQCSPRFDLFGEKSSVNMVLVWRGVLT